LRYIKQVTFLSGLEGQAEKLILIIEGQEIHAIKEKGENDV
jgi:hypothetical protein